MRRLTLDNVRRNCSETKASGNGSLVDGDGEGGWILFVYFMNIAAAFIKMYK